MGRHDSTGLIHHRRTLAALAVTAAIGLGACSAEDDAASDATSAPDSPSATEAPAEAEGGPGVGDRETATDQATAGLPSTALPTAAPLDSFGRDLIIEAGLSIATADVARTLDDVYRVTANNGGAVFRSDVRIDDPNEDGSVPGGGIVVVRIPPAGLDRLITDLSGVATVTNTSSQTDDVTDQLVDLDIRIEQALTGIELFEGLLARAVTIDEIVQIETELSRRQIVLEQLRAQQRNTEDRVALSTLTIDISYRSPDEPSVAPVDDDPGIADAFSDGWDAFAGFLFAVAFVAAVAAPFMAVAVLGSLGLWLLRRRWVRRRTALGVGRTTRLDAPPAPLSEPSERPAGEPLADASPRG